MPESIVTRAQSLRLLAERKLNVEQRAVAATRLADRTRLLLEWTDALDTAEQVRRLLEEEGLSDVPVSERVSMSTAQAALKAYCAIASSPEDETRDNGQAAWSALARPMKGLLTRVQNDVRDNLSSQKRACLDLVSVAELTELTAVPGLEEPARKLQTLRKEVADGNWLDPSPLVLQNLLRKAGEFADLLTALSDQGPPPPDEVKRFCALARSPVGAPVAKLTKEVAEWFDQMKQAGRLRIHMK